MILRGSIPGWKEKSYSSSVLWCGSRESRRPWRKRRSSRKAGSSERTRSRKSRSAADLGAGGRGPVQQGLQRSDFSPTWTLAAGLGGDVAGGGPGSLAGGQAVPMCLVDDADSAAEGPRVYGQQRLPAPDHCLRRRTRIHSPAARGLAAPGRGPLPGVGVQVVAYQAGPSGRSPYGVNGLGSRSPRRSVQFLPTMTRSRSTWDRSTSQEPRTLGSKTGLAVWTGGVARPTTAPFGGGESHVGRQSSRRPRCATLVCAFKRPGFTRLVPTRGVRPRRMPLPHHYQATTRGPPTSVVGSCSPPTIWTILSSSRRCRG